ncbi:MAG: hypothetical protein K5634_03050 [Sphaerochaetaceae bacterium]|nr:hypothetical protein [Sphaerochaetaceae bacterium]
MSSGFGSNRKTNLFSIIIVVVLLSLLVSCGTRVTTVPDRDPTIEEADQALHMAIDTAKQNADYEFYNEVRKSIFLPDQYSRLSSESDSIPGMNSMIDQWNEYIGNFIYSHIDEFYTFISDRVSTLLFDDPFEYVNSSDTSASDMFIRLYKDDITGFWNQYIGEIDDSAVDDMLNQLRNWDVNQNLLYDTPVIEPENTDIPSFLVGRITSMYLDLLSLEEELFRTTPDPYGDQTSKLVFKTY